MVPGADNRLDLFLLRVLSCNQVTAVLRVNTLFKYIMSEPTRWLAGKAGELGWGLDDSAEMIDLVEKFMVEIAADGSKLFDASYDPFASIAGKNEKFADWRTEYFQRTAKSLDNTAQYAVHGLTLAEARNPVAKVTLTQPTALCLLPRRWRMRRWSRCATRGGRSVNFS